MVKEKWISGFCAARGTDGALLLVNIKQGLWLRCYASKTVRKVASKYATKWEWVWEVKGSGKTGSGLRSRVLGRGATLLRALRAAGLM